MLDQAEEVTMKIGPSDQPDFIHLAGRPRPLLQNILTLLGQYPNRVVRSDEICETLRIDRRHLAAYVSVLRTHLAPQGDWIVVHQRQDKGYRLIDLRDK